MEECHPGGAAGANGAFPVADDDPSTISQRGPPSLTPQEFAEHDRCGALISCSSAMRETFRKIRKAAPTPISVFLSGETGTGKDLAARALHDLSPRHRGAFVALNCGAVSASLVESELFGHERGSFTGAVRTHDGVFAQANNGTLFLDEVTEMPLDLQVRLLRVLESGTFQRVGGEQTVRVETRIVAASNRDPLAEVRAGRFRADLYYRLHVFPIALPPLRERPSDVLLLAQHFLAAQNRRHVTSKAFTVAALDRLRAHPWPGNVRQLANYVQCAFLMADDTIGIKQLPHDLLEPTRADSVEIVVGTSIAAAEQQLIVATMAHCDGNKHTAARLLRISIKTLYSRLAVYAAGAPQRWRSPAATRGATSHDWRGTNSETSPIGPRL